MNKITSALKNFQFNRAQKTLLTVFLGLTVIFSVFSFALVNSNTSSQTANAAIEPTCSNRSVGNTATWNAFPKNTGSFNNPDFSTPNCLDLPDLSFFNTGNIAARNRVLTTSNSSTSVQLYYSNSAAPGGSAIQNPTAGIQIIRDPVTNVYTVRSTLSGSNVATRTTVAGQNAANNGDLTINVPAGYRLTYQTTADWFPQAIIRREIADGLPFWTNPANPSVQNPLNPAAGRTTSDALTAANLFTRFDGQPAFTPSTGVNLSYADIPSQLTSNPPTDPAWYPAGTNASTLYPDGVRDTNSPNQLPAGYLNYGYVLFSLRIVQDANPQPNLEIVKSTETLAGVNMPNGSSVNQGDSYTYRLRFRNTGSNPATGIVLTDTLDSKLGYVSCTAPVNFTCSNNGQVVTWTQNSASSLAPAAAYLDATVTVRVNQGALGTILNTGFIRSEQTPNTPSNETNHIINTPQTALSIVKSANPVSGSNVALGSTIAYTLNVRNTGSSAATNVVVSDTIDPNLSYVAGSCAPNNSTPFSCSYNSTTRVLSWNAASFAASNTATSLTFSVTVNSATPPSTSLRNRASIVADNAPLVNSNQTIHFVNAPVLSTNLQIQKSLNTNPATVSPNQVLTYTLQFRNVGTAPATGVLIQDFLDPDVTYVANSCTVTGLPAGAVCSINNGILSWSGFGLAANQTAFTSVTYQVTVNSNAAGIVHNLARITSVEDPQGDEDEVIVPIVVPIANLQIQKSLNTNPATVSPNQTLNYTLQFRNIGTGPATQVVVQDFLDPDVTYVANSCSTAGLPAGATCSHSGGTITWSGFSLPANQLVYLPVTYQVTVNPNAAGTIRNLARITSPEDPQGDEDEVIVPVVLPSVILRINKASSVATTRPGETITYTLTFQNQGVSPATNVVIRDTLDPQVTYNTRSCSQPSPALTGVSCSQATPGVLTWNIPTLPANSGIYTVTYTVVVNANATVQVRNVVTIRSTEDPNGDTDTVIIPISPASSSSSSLSSSSLSSSTSSTSSSTSSSSVSSSSSSTSSSSSISSSISSSTSSSSSSSVPPTGVSIVKSVDAGNNNQVFRGQNLTYTLAVSNTTTTSLSNLVISDILDANLTFVSCSNSCVYNTTTRQLTWNITLAASSTTNLTFIATVNSNASGTITNVAVVNCPATNSNCCPNNNCNSNTVINNVNTNDFTFTKTVSDTDRIVTSNQVVTYTLTYQNRGAQAQTGVVITDILPSGLTFQGVSTCSPTCTFNSATSTITWSIPNIAPGAVGSVRFDAMVNASATGTITNVGRISSTQNPVPTEARVDVTVRNIVIGDTARSGGNNQFSIAAIVLVAVSGLCLAIYSKSIAFKRRKGYLK
jgi:uncharacterized repeat protein (TIGR01451 family)